MSNKKNRPKPVTEAPTLAALRTLSLASPAELHVMNTLQPDAVELLVAHLTDAGLCRLPKGFLA